MNHREKTGVLDARKGRKFFFPRSLQPDPGLDTHTHTHTHLSRAARKVEEVEKVGGAYFKKKDKRGGGTATFPV